MRSAHLTASTFFGGPERQMLELAGALPAHLSTTFFSFAESGGCQKFLGRVRDQGFEGIELKHDTPWLWAAGRELTEKLIDLRVQVLFCHGYKADIVGRGAARRAGIPVAAVSRGWTGESRRVRLYEALDRIVLRGMDRVVCVSTAQAERVLRAGVAADRVRVIANAIRGSRFAEPDPSARLELERLLPRCRRIVAGAGRLSPEKGFEVLVDAAARCRDRSTGFVLWGDGPLREALAQRTEQAGLRDRFVLAGFRSDLDRLLPAVDLLVLPSYTEGMPNVALEALAAGVPVVATAVGGTPEVVDATCGRLVPPGNPAALAEAIDHVLADEDHRQHLGQRGRDRVESCFTFEAQARQYVELLEEMTKAGTSATGGMRGFTAQAGVRV